MTITFDQAIQAIIENFNSVVDENDSLITTIEKHDTILAGQNSAIMIQNQSEKELVKTVESLKSKLKIATSQSKILAEENKKVNELRANNKKLKAQVDRLKPKNDELSKANARLEKKLKATEDEYVQHSLDLRNKNNELTKALEKAGSEIAASGGWLIHSDGDEYVFLNPEKITVNGELQVTLMYKKGSCGILRQVGLNGIDLMVAVFEIQSPSEYSRVNKWLPEPSDEIKEYMLATLLELKANDWNYIVK